MTIGQAQKLDQVILTIVGSAAFLLVIFALSVLVGWLNIPPEAVKPGDDRDIIEIRFYFGFFILSGVYTCFRMLMFIKFIWEKMGD